MIVSLFVGFSSTVYVNKNKTIFYCCTYISTNCVCCVYICYNVFDVYSDGSNKDLVEKHSVWVNLEDEVRMD